MLVNLGLFAQSIPLVMPTDHWIKKIEEISEEVKQLISDKDVETLNWKSSEDEWSALQVLDHLTTVNSSYFTISEDLRNGTYKTPFLGRINFFVNLFGRLILKSVQPEETKKTRTFPIWKPASSALDQTTITTFFDTQTKLIDWIKENIDLIEQNPVISSPASINVVYRLQVALAIIVTHEERHLLQIKNILQQAAV